MFPSRGDAGPEDLWRKSLERPGGERKLVRKYGAFGLLVVDEWLLDRPDTEFRSILMELRYGTASTVFCTQFKNKDWHPRLGGGVHADAIMEGSCTTRSGSPWARQTCGSAADRPVAIKKSTGASVGPGAQARYRRCRFAIFGSAQASKYSMSLGSSPWIATFSLRKTRIATDFELPPLANGSREK